MNPVKKGPRANVATPYGSTSLGFSNLATMDTQIAAIVTALQTAVTSIAATTPATIVNTNSPDDTTTATAAAIVFGEIQSTWIRNPVLVQLNLLIDQLNTSLADYGVTVFPAAPNPLIGQGIREVLAASRKS